MTTPTVSKSAHSPLPTSAGTGAGASAAEWDEASFFQKWTYKVVNAMLTRGEISPLQQDDLMRLPASDHSRALIKDFQAAYDESTSCGIVPRLVVALAKTQSFVFALTAILTFLEGAFRVTTPIFLGMFLNDLQDEDSPTKNIFLLALVLSILNICQTFTHHVVFYYTMRLGYTFRTSTIGMIFNHLFTLPGSALDSSSVDTGKLINLISNDVQRFEEAAVFFHFLWASLLESFTILVLLSIQLNVVSGLAGVGMTVLAIPVQLKVAKELSKRRGKVARSTDSRVKFMSEVITGISSVKSFAWEGSFVTKLQSIRLTEVNYMRFSLVLKSINYALYFCSPHVASFTTFMTFVALGGTLTLPKVFTVMSLLQVLRLVIGRAWTRAIETCSEAVASCNRIESFLVLSEDLKEKDSDQLTETGVQAPPAENSELITLNKVKGETVVEIPLDCCFSYHSSSTTTLQNIKMSVAFGEVLMVVGPVGSGKSSLLAALLGELNATGVQRDVVVDGEVFPVTPGDSTGRDYVKWTCRDNTRVAFCSQRPWIVASSVKANVVLAGKDSPSQIKSRAESTLLDEEDFKYPSYLNDALYHEAITMCKLNEDFRQWPERDDTEIGERGVSVSGGQKARIALARAIYSDADVYLLDDVLSAVDAHVGKDLFFEAILSCLKKKRNKAIVLVTHQLQHMQHADKILVLDKNGSQTFFGSYSNLKKSGKLLEELGVEMSTGHDNDSNDQSVEQLSASQGGKRSRSSTIGSYTMGDEEGGMYGSAGLVRNEPVSLDFVSSEGELEVVNEENQLEETTNNEGDIDDDDTNKLMRNTIIQSEDRNLGHITLKTYLTYFKSGGLSTGILALLYAILGQALSMLADYWLRWWAEGRFGEQGNPLYKWVFAILVASTILVGYHKAHVWLNFALDASSSLHSRSLWAVLHSPMQFFVANPTGRILNRFSRDQNLVDEVCPATFFDFIQTTLFCLAAIILLCISLPWLLILVPVIYYLFVFLRSKYIKSSREIKRLEAVSRSPIYADFSAALDGLNTLRAYKLEERITTSFYSQLDKNQRVWHSFLMVSRWLGFRLDFMCTFILIVMVFLSASLKGKYDVGLIGFALVYTLSLSGLAQWSVRQSAEVENQMTAMERINTYAHLPPEVGYKAKLGDAYSPRQTPGFSSHKSDGQQKKSYIATTTSDEDSADMTAVELVVPGGEAEQNFGGGTIDIKNLTVTYRQDLPPVLRQLDIHIWAGCKAGIVGRTGSGKSSFLLALLRLNIITEGDILLDGESLLEMSLEEARDAIAMIPQDPHLFSSTIRYNLDPLQRHTDAELWNALEDAHIKDYIASHELGLSMMVEEGGKNFSVGQRQLISLARAIVRRSRVVLMDEVTASIDYETDKLIQNTIRTSPTLKNATIITVAHRLRTIADSDLIGVVSSGKFVEVGSPLSLLRQEDSYFRKLADESHEYDELVNISSKKKTQK